MRPTQVLLSLMLISFLLEAQVLAQKKCRKQKIKNGRMLIRKAGAMAIYKCKKGFNVVGHTTSECLETGWNPAPPVCIAAEKTTGEAPTITTMSTTPKTKKSAKATRKEIDCPAMSIANGKAELKVRLMKLIFSCNSGFKMVGTSFTKCVDGRWTREPPKCVSAGSSPTTSFTSSKTKAITAAPLVTTSTIPSATSSPPVITPALRKATVMPSNASDAESNSSLSTKAMINIEAIRVTSVGGLPMDSSTTDSTTPMSSLTRVTKTGTSPKTYPETTSSIPPPTTTTLTNPGTAVLIGAWRTQKTTVRVPEITSAPSPAFTIGVKHAKVKLVKGTVAMFPSVSSTTMPLEVDSTENRSSPPTSTLNTTPTKVEPVEETIDSIPPTSTLEISEEVETSKQTTYPTEGSVSPSVTPTSSSNEINKMAAYTTAVHSVMTSWPRLRVSTSSFPRKHSDTSERLDSSIFTTISHVKTEPITTAIYRAGKTTSTAETVPLNGPHPGISDKETTMGSPNNEDSSASGGTSTVVPDSKPILVDSLKDTSTARIMPEVVVMIVGFVVGVIVIGTVAWLWERNRRKIPEAVGKDEEMGMQPVDAAAVARNDTAALSGGDTSAMSGGDTNAVSGGDTSAMSGGDTSAMSGGDTNAVSLDDNTVGCGDDTTAASVVDTMTASGGDNTAVSGGDTAAVPRDHTTAVSGNGTAAVSGDGAAAVSVDGIIAVSGDGTTAVPVDGTAAVPGDGAAAVSVDGTTAVSGDGTPVVPGDHTTAVPGDGNTAVPGDGTTAVPGDDTNAVSMDGTK